MDHFRRIPSNNAKDTYSIELRCNSCRKCKRQERDFFHIPFMECIFNILALEFDIDIQSVQHDDEIIFSRNKIIEIKDFISNIHYFEDFNEKLHDNLKSECIKYNRDCFLSEITKPREIEQIISKNFFFKHFIKYIQYIKKIRGFLINNPGCQNCLKIGTQSIDKILGIFKKIKIVKKLLVINQDLNYFLNINSFNIFNYILMQDIKQKTSQNGKTPSKLKKLDRYYSNASRVYEYNIYAIGNKQERLYEIKQNVPFSGEFLDFLKSEVDTGLKDDESILKFHKFNDILYHVIRFAKQKLQHLLIVDSLELFNTLVEIIAFSILGLEKLFPLLIDDQIEEIFLDSPKNCIYIHHVAHQQCITDIKLEKREINRIISLLRFETNKNLNELYPTLKCVIKNSFFYIRINVDIKPLSFNGFSLDIRRLNKKIFDIIDLIRLNSLSIAVAAFLIFCVQIKRNLTIIGRTDSGKTTLLNALDLIYPENFRKIYVEDVVETVNQDPSKYHQLKFQSDDKDLKPRIIKNLLHRTPDVLILGEILTKDEVDALFHCLSVGLKGMQTIHANNSEAFLRRLCIHFDIDPVCLKDLDFIVYLKKFENGARKVIELSEVKIVDGFQGTHILIKYSPKVEVWSDLNHEDSSLIGGFLENSKMDEKKLKEYLMHLETVLRNAIADPEYQRQDLIQRLNQVYIDHVDYF